MESVSLGDFSIRTVEPGTKRRLSSHAFQGLSGPVALPILIAKGTRDGRTLLAVAGVHGDEYEGMEAIRLAFETLDVASMSGSFIGLPVANPFAYEARTRSTPLHVDGLNLARIFPGDPMGSPSRILAHRLIDFVLRNLTPDDLFVDFHSGSVDVPFVTLIGFRDVGGPVRDRAEEAARHFGVQRLWRIPDAPGPFSAETTRRGIVTLGTETTGRAGCEPTDVADFVRGLRNLLAYLGIARDAAPTRYEGPARTTVDVLSCATGFLRGARRLLDEVRAGDLLGTVITPYGDPIVEITAPISGTIWAARSLPAVRTGELVYMVAERP